VVIIDNVIETQSPLMIFIRTKLNDHQQLNDLIEDPYPEQAPKDPQFPYIVYDISNDYSPEGLVARSTLTIDLYDYYQDSLRIYKMRGYIIQIFDKLKTSIPGISSARFFFRLDNAVPEQDEKVKHRNMQFEIRYDRKVELNQILRRDNNG